MMTKPMSPESSKCIQKPYFAIASSNFEPLLNGDEYAGFKKSVVITGSLMLAFLVWGHFTVFDESISASGQLLPAGHVQSVQHLEGGTISEIYVEDGELVDKGQQLLRLNGNSAQADLAQMHSRQDSLKAELSRLKTFSSPQTAGSPLSLTDDEKAILTSMEQSRDRQRAVLDMQISQKKKEFLSLSLTKTMMNKNLHLLKHENGIKMSLAAKGFGSQLMAITSQRELNEAEAKFNDIVSMEARAQDALEEAKRKRQALDADLLQQAMKRYGEIQAQLAELSSSLTKLEDAAARTIITSPVRGYIKGLGVHTLGGVVEAGKLLLEIVPINTPLQLEAIIEPQDIARVHEGEKVKIKVSAYDYARYGYATGHVSNVSASTFQTAEGRAFYKTKIALDQPYIGNADSGARLSAGMTVDASIITGEKTVLQYLLKPVYTLSEGAFREH